MDLAVKPGVFIPRPETEVLVAEVLKYAPQILRQDLSPHRILDLGVGSGNIGLVIAKFPGDL